MPEPRAPGAAFPEREQPPGTGCTAPQLCLSSASQMPSETSHTRVPRSSKAPALRLAVLAFQEGFSERWRLLQQAGEARGRAEQGVRAFGSKEQQEKRPGQVGGRLQPPCMTSLCLSFPPSTQQGRQGAGGRLQLSKPLGVLGGKGL